ncbi:MAG: 16S rRNA (guanine(527)-N(7))-methyltransferase RsmG [Butyricicoccus sp.]|nr:16S rRNA (guanine(527)-N(7))-methyltransferase RsmG [Butyricicoccus sp.]
MLEDILRSGLSEMGLSAGERAAERFRLYYDLLSEKNAVMNLTAISGEKDTARLHFMDSLSPLLLFDMAGRSVIDVGTGAGFPGLPLKIACPGLKLMLLDSQNKRVEFLSEVCQKLGLEDVECVHGRAEEFPDRRESYDFAVSRAVARLNVLCELCLPYVIPGGAFLALKGPALAEELEEAKKAVSLLGGKLERVFDYAIPGVEARHNIAVIRKVSPTPHKYPRRFALIKKSPL